MYRPMTKEEANSLIKTLKQVRERAKGDPEYAKQILLEAGIIDESGRLAEPYRLS